MSNNLGIRFNYGGLWGFGHLFRCRLLAKTLSAEGISVTFICNKQKAEQEELPGADIPVISVEEDVLLPENGDFSDSVLIVDLPQPLSRKEVTEARGRVSSLALLDQHGDQIDAADLVINAIAHPDNSQEEPSGRCKSGEKYLMLDPELLVTKEEQPQQVEKVLITMGGSDPHEISTRVARLLSPLHPGLRFSLLIGPGFEHQEELEALAEDFPNLEIIIGGDNSTVAAALTKHDCGVISFGLTTYAAAHAGLPCLVLAHNADGARAAAAFSEKFDSVVDLGQHDLVSDDRLMQSFFGLVTDHQLRLRLSENGKRAVDGLGLERVVGLVRGLFAL